MFKIFYDSQGNILSTHKIDPLINVVNDNASFIQVENIPQGKYKVNLSTFQLEEISKETNIKPLSWFSNRRINYGSAEQQLNFLYDDIKAGKFGPEAQNGSWFKHIEKIKKQFPKP